MNTAGLRGELGAAGGLRWEFILGEISKQDVEPKKSQNKLFYK